MGISILTPVLTPPVMYSTPPNDVSLTAAVTGVSTQASPGDHVHKVNDTGWQTPTLSGAWVNYSTGWRTARYRRVDGLVIIEGLVRSGTGTIFTLPVGYRPLENLLFAVDGDTQVHKRVDVNGDGTVVFNGPGGAPGYMGINCIFYAEQ